MIKPTVKLIGENGNVFNIIGKVSRELKRAGLREQTEEFQSKALTSNSYDEVLQLVLEYVKVE